MTSNEICTNIYKVECLYVGYVGMCYRATTDSEQSVVSRRRVGIVLQCRDLLRWEADAGTACHQKCFSRFP